MAKKCYIHRPNCQNHCHNKLGSCIHLQIPNKEHRNDTQSPIGCTGDGRVDICRINGDRGIDATPFSTSILRPEVSRRTALKHEEEEEKGAVDFNNCDGRPYNDPVDSGNCDTKEKDGDAEFEGHVGEYIDGFTRPPPLQSYGNLGGRKGVSMLACAVVDSCDRKRAEEGEEDLRCVSNLSS